MKLLGKKLLSDFKQKHANARSQIDSWMAEIEGTKWDDPHDIKRRYPKASVLGNQQVIFDICGSKYRLWVSITYKSGMVLVRNIGTHDEYDKWKIDK